MEQIQEDLNISEEKDEEEQICSETTEKPNEPSIVEGIQENVEGTMEQIGEGGMEQTEQESENEVKNIDEGGGNIEPPAYDESVAQGTFSVADESSSVAVVVEGEGVEAMETGQVGEDQLLEPENILETEEADPTLGSVEDQLHELDGDMVSSSGDMVSSTVKESEPSTSYAQPSVTNITPSCAENTPSSSALEPDDGLPSAPVVSGNQDETTGIPLESDKEAFVEADTPQASTKDQSSFDSKIEMEQHEDQFHQAPMKNVPENDATNDEDKAVPETGEIRYPLPDTEGLPDLDTDGEPQPVAETDLPEAPEEVPQTETEGGSQGGVGDGDHGPESAGGLSAAFTGDLGLAEQGLEALANLKRSTDMPNIYSAEGEEIEKKASLPTRIVQASNITVPKTTKVHVGHVLQAPQTPLPSVPEDPVGKQLDRKGSQFPKKDTPETDDLATLANAALTCDQAANGAKPPEEPQKKEPVWCDVGIIKGTSCHVTFYHEPSANHDPEHENITIDNLPDYTNSIKLDLEPGTAYKFRVCAINSCGRSPWSEVSAFKTCLPGYPGAPSSIKISKSGEGAHLSWEPPSNPAGNIIEYSVCLAVRNTGQPVTMDQKGQQLSFVRVYSGPQNQTIVPNSSLAAAHLDTTSKPAIIFRIAAKNEKGFGPATQVRWLQDVVAAPTASVKSMMKKEPISSNIPLKRPKMEDF